ncbi:MAG: hypothetical protein JKY96_00055, partial [Phycisphaerales bacterium]|nr:hypothetical protein [Phycisphaerales bacterium]
MKRTLAILFLVGGVSLAVAADPPAEDQAKTELQPDSQGKKAQRKVDAIRHRLQEAIVRGERQLERNREALEKLDNGETPTAVLRNIRRYNLRPNRLQQEERKNAREGTDRPDRKSRLVEVYAFIGEHIPELNDQLVQMAAVDQRAADQIVMRVLPRIDSVMQSYKNDPELGELKINELRAGLGFVQAIRLYRSLEDPTTEQR